MINRTKNFPRCVWIFSPPPQPAWGLFLELSVRSVFLTFHKKNLAARGINPPRLQFSTGLVRFG